MFPNSENNYLFLHFQIIDMRSVGKGCFSSVLWCTKCPSFVGSGRWMPDREWLCIFKSCPVELLAITYILGDRDRCDLSVVTHFCTTSVWLEVTPVSPLMFSSAAGQHNDARMNLAIALTAARYGAATANYMEVVRLLKKTDPQTGKELVCGARCKDALTGTPRLWQRGLSEHLALPMEWLNYTFSVSSLLFKPDFRVILIIFLIVNNAWFNVKIFPCETWQFSPFVLNDNNDNNNNKCPQNSHSYWMHSVFFTKTCY